MCIIHEASFHYLFQDLMIAFEQSKTLSALFLRRVGCLLCNCKNDFLYDSKNIIGLQRSLYQWFEDSVKESQRLISFKTIVEEFKNNGAIDSGTKITLLNLLKDIDSYNFYKLRSIVQNNNNNNNNNNQIIKKTFRRNVFFTKLIKLKFDLKLCSVKEFIELLSKIDNCAIKYIQLTTKSKITLRDLENLTIRNFMGELEATIESKFERNLKSSEFYLKRLADAVHYRLAKQIPSSDTIVGSNSFTSLKILLQSPPESSFSEKSDSSYNELSSSYLASDCKTLDNKTTSDFISTSHSQAEISSADFSKNISSSLSSNTLNGDHDSSVLSVSKNSVGTSTPLTSSPISSSSDSKSKFKLNEKQKKVNYKKKNIPRNNEDKKPQVKETKPKKTSTSISNTSKNGDNLKKMEEKNQKMNYKPNHSKISNSSINKLNSNNHSINICQ